MTQVNFTTLEEARLKLSIVRTALEEVDKLYEALATARWRYEMLRLDPSLGQTDRGLLDPMAMYTNLKKLEDNLKTAVQVALYLTTTDHIGKARETYMEALVAFQTVATLLEAFPRAVAGTDVREEVRKVSAEELPRSPNGQAAFIEESLLPKAFDCFHDWALNVPELSSVVPGTLKLS